MPNVIHQIKQKSTGNVYMLSPYGAEQAIAQAQAKAEEAGGYARVAAAVTEGLANLVGGDDIAMFDPTVVYVKGNLVYYKDTTDSEFLCYRCKVNSRPAGAWDSNSFEQVSLVQAYQKILNPEMTAEEPVVHVKFANDASASLNGIEVTLTRGIGENAIVVTKYTDQYGMVHFNGQGEKVPAGTEYTISVEYKSGYMTVPSKTTTANVEVKHIEFVYHSDDPGIYVLWDEGAGGTSGETPITQWDTARNEYAKLICVRFTVSGETDPREIYLSAKYEYNAGCYWATRVKNEGTAETQTAWYTNGEVTSKRNTDQILSHTTGPDAVAATVFPAANWARNSKPDVVVGQDTYVGNVASGAELVWMAASQGTGATGTVYNIDEINSALLKVGGVALPIRQGNIWTCCENSPESTWYLRPNGTLNNDYYNGYARKAINSLYVVRVYSLINND